MPREQPTTAPPHTDAARSTIRDAWQRATVIVVGAAIVLLLVHGFLVGTVTSEAARRGVFVLTATGFGGIILLSLLSLRPLILPMGEDETLTPPRLQERVEALEARVEELQRSNRELEAFASVASHDLKEPLRLIASYLHLLERQYGDELDEEARSYIEEATEGAERMNDLIAGLLAYARAGAEDRSLEAVSLDIALDQAIENLSLRIEETDATIQRTELPEVLGDRTQLIQVFQNLIGNAIKFAEEDIPPVVRIEGDREGETWRIDVRDNGIGFDPEEHDAMFRIFERGSSASGREGTGVGLAVCKRVLTRHGGEIEASSTPGEGSTFTMRLPIISEGGEMERVAERSRELV